MRVISFARTAFVGLILIGVPALSGNAHDGNRNPISEGWTLVAGDAGASGLALADPDYPVIGAWEIDEPGAETLRYQRTGPGSAGSWILESRLRVVALADPADAGIRVEVANGVSRFALDFGSDAQGGTEIVLVGAGVAVAIAPLSAPGVRTDYVNVQLVYSAVDGAADLFVNGLEVASDWVGDPSALDRVLFGDGSNEPGGRARYARVWVLPQDAACRNGVDDDEDLRRDFVGGDPDCSQENDPTETAPTVPCPFGGVDTDGDYVCDFDEGLFGASPLDPDSDGDGVDDGAEIWSGTLPSDPDSDDDGLSDGDEPASNGFEFPQVIASTSSPRALVDLDGDTDLDLLAAGGSSVDWFENVDGAGTFGAPRAIGTHLLGAVAAGDIDGDGDSDVVQGSYSAFTCGRRIVWHENIDGVGKFGPERSIAPATCSGVDIELADIDGDVDLDVLVVTSAPNQAGTIIWYENLDGQGSFGPEQVVEEITYPTQIIAVDVDGDGDLDIAVGAFWSGGAGWYENLDGQGTFVAGGGIPVGHPNSVVSLDAADFDGDGDVDFVAGTLDGIFLEDSSVVWCENVDGAGTAWTVHEISYSAMALVDGLSWVATADMDGDGDVDVASAEGPYSGGTVRWFENTDGDGAFGPARPIWFDAGTIVMAGDLDGDGDVDLVSGTRFLLAGMRGSGIIAWYERTGIIDAPLDPDRDDDGLCDGGLPGTAAACALGGEDVNGNGRYDAGIETDPDDADTDDDRVLDGAEVVAGTNPLDPNDFPDLDDDGVADPIDNCVVEANGPNQANNQIDGDLDGYGNACDVDYNNSGATDGGDFAIWIAAFNSLNAVVDLTGDGVVNGADFGPFVSSFNEVPGPSGLPCAGTIPCTP